MEKICWDILIGMEDERELLKELVVLSTEKTEVLATRDIEEIERITHEENGLVIKVESLESLRKEQLQMLSEIKGVEADSIIMSDLIEWTEGDMKDRFKSLMDEMETLIAKQKQINEINYEIIRANLAYFDFFMYAITGEGSSGQVYEKQGKVSQGTQSRNIFDTQA